MRSYNRFPQIIATLDPRVKAALVPAADIIANAAKARVPVESGDLRDAIHLEDADDGVAVVAGGGDVFYGHMVEFGTSHSAARPFMVPAAEENRDTAVAAVAAALRSL
jgi:HK97 gp10 family phage protein